jgi:CDP-6-deoxy-D-xylo-4-hexulose-3-dehydrase
MTEEKGSKIEVPYAATIYNEDEVNAVLDVLKNPKKIVAGHRVKEFEQKIAALFGKRYGVMVNSGSSANLIALDVLDLPKGSEVITPVLTFGTTLSPILQKGLKPVFVDVVSGSYQIDVDKIEELITERTKVLMIPSLLGNVPDMEKLRSLADKYNLYFIEDSCDTLGAKFNGRPTGFYSDISTTSFYASHVITACGSGGMVCFHDEELAKRALIKSNWGRESTLFGVYEKSEDLQKRFSGSLDGDTYDAKFIFSEIGYNFQSTELNGAFGLVQLKRFNKFSDLRKKHFFDLMNFFGQYQDVFILPKQDDRVENNWLCFPLTVRENVGFTRNELTQHLEKHNIQTRPIFTGNVLKQPAFKHLQNNPDYPNTDYIMKNSFVVGCHHGLREEQIAYMKNIFIEFLKSKKQTVFSPSDFSTDKQKNILVTGGYGFIGSNFIHHIYNKYPDYKIFNIDLLTYAGNTDNLVDVEHLEKEQEINNKRYQFLYGDICDKRFLDIIFSRHNFDIVINFAAETHVDRSIVDMSDFIYTNIGGVRCLIEAVREYNVPRFVHISTDEIYGDIKSGYSTETSDLRPSNPYSSSKAAADLIVQSFIRTHNVPAIIVRGSNNFGPNQYPEKLIPLAITNILEGRRVPIHGKGLHVRSWVHVKDFCEAVDLIAHDAPNYEIYNVHGEEKTNIEILKNITDNMGVKMEDCCEYIGDRPGADTRYAVDASKLQTQLNWEPKHSIEKDLSNVIKWYVENHDWWKKIKITNEYQDHYIKQSKAKWY